MARHRSRRRRLPWWIAKARPVGFSARRWHAFCQRFGTAVDPDVARVVTAEILAEAVTRKRGVCVGSIVGSLAHRLGMCRSRVFNHYAAGRWLAEHE